MNTFLSQKISVLASSQWWEHAEAFARAYQLQCLPCSEDDADPWSKRDAVADSGSRVIETPYVLAFLDDGVSLKQLGKRAPGPISASFLHGKNAHRRQFGGGKGQLIAKAVGLKSGIIPSVLDATAGLGKDAFVLASLGCDVQMLEKSPVVAELLRWALEEAKDSEISDIIQRMHLIEQDAVDWMRSQDGPLADVIHLDPMYPERDKSALVKKEMRAFHDLVGTGEDESDLLEIALTRARYRVVVKRPRKGELISGPAPTYQLSGKTCRYDIYTLKSMNELRLDEKLP